MPTCNNQTLLTGEPVNNHSNALPAVIRDYLLEFLLILTVIRVVQHVLIVALVRDIIEFRDKVDVLDTDVDS